MSPRSLSVCQMSPRSLSAPVTPVVSYHCLSVSVICPPPDLVYFNCLHAGNTWLPCSCWSLSLVSDNGLPVFSPLFAHPLLAPLHTACLWVCTWLYGPSVSPCERSSFCECVWLCLSRGENCPLPLGSFGALLCRCTALVLCRRACRKEATCPGGVWKIWSLCHNPRADCSYNSRFCVYLSPTSGV